MRRKGFWILAAMVAMVFGLTFNAMAEEGVTDTEIHIGQWGPQTGPAAPWGSVARGTGDWFKMINAEGGINGRPVELITEDDGTDPNRGAEAVENSPRSR